MCGRYAFLEPLPRLVQYFGVSGSNLALEGRYNAAPGQKLPVISAGIGGDRRLIGAQWGLVPGWAKPGSKLPKPINAQSETAALKPMFGSAMRRRRILVPASHFYEWKTVAGRKQPMLIRLRSREPMGLAGLLEFCNDHYDSLYSFVILTVAPNELVSTIHGRMPAIIQPADFALWLDPETQNMQQVLPMLRPFPSDEMEAFPISTLVNNTRNEGPGLIEPLPVTR